jgi:hypothetical protein
MAQTATVASERARGRFAQDRRGNDRYPLGEAMGTLIHNGVKSPCELIDISLDGCCIHSKDSFPHGALAYVEVVLHLFGMVLRIGGETQWTRRQHLIGVRFIHPTTRAKNELAGLLTCLVDAEAVEEIQEALAVARVDPLSVRVLAAETPAVEKSVPKPKSQPRGAAPPATPTKEPFDWSAAMYFLKEKIILHGSIDNLHHEGCDFLLSEPYAGSYSSRVEIEFKMRGLPFRLGGSMEATGDPRIVAIRFIDISARKRDEVAQLVEEIRQERREEAETDGARL